MAYRGRALVKKGPKSRQNKVWHRDESVAARYGRDPSAAPVSVKKSEVNPEEDDDMQKLLAQFASNIAEMEQENSERKKVDDKLGGPSSKTVENAIKIIPKVILPKKIDTKLSSKNIKRTKIPNDVPIPSPELSPEVQLKTEDLRNRINIYKTRNRSPRREVLNQMNKKQKLELLDFHAQNSLEKSSKSQNLLPSSTKIVHETQSSSKKQPSSLPIFPSSFTPPQNTKIPNSKFLCRDFATKSVCPNKSCNLLHSQKPEHIPHCFDYLSNRCALGKFCPFIHVNLPRKTTVLCETYQNLGFCVNVSACNKWHFDKCDEYATCVSLKCDRFHERDWLSLKVTKKAPKNADKKEGKVLETVIEYDVLTHREMGVNNESFRCDGDIATSDPMNVNKNKTSTPEKSFIQF